MRPAETSQDRLLDGRLRLIQPKNGYRAAIDPVLLAAAVQATAADETVLDLGCGAGAAALCLLARQPKLQITGLEIQPDLARLARENARINGVSDRLQILDGSLCRPPAELEPASFVHVMANPPFIEAGAGTRPPSVGRATSHMEITAELELWIDAAARFLKPRGRLTLIHRAARLDALLAKCREKFGAIVVYPLWPKQGVPAKRILLRARLGLRTPTEIKSGLVLHNEDGSFTPAAQRILRSGEALEF